MAPSTQRADSEVRRAQIDALGAFGYNAQSMLVEASNLIEAGGDEKRREAFKICRDLLSFPQLGDLHKAGCHTILAYGQEDFV